MKKIVLTLFTIGILASPFAKADEGMWLPMLLKNNYAEMQRLGLKLTAEQLYDINTASLKDAIVWFNGGCTAEIVSDKGLLFTNHHCGYGAIANHSTPSDNILDNGFWAKSFSEEKENANMWASVLVRMEDVSDRVNKAIAGVEAKKVDSVRGVVFKAIQKEATEKTTYEATVKSFFKDNAYYLFVFEKFTDIRLVATPPQSIGKFGGDTDNWMWPRHTGDFSIFRIYANKDNKPATYSKDNVPYTPKKFLNVSIKGLQEGDYTMVYGFPGRTNRYETSMGIQTAIEKTNPATVDLRDIRLKAWKEEMTKSDSVRLLLSSRYASIANYWKYYIGQTEQLKRLKVLDEKQEMEKRFNQWAKNKPEYANILQHIQDAYIDYNKYALHRTYINEGVFGSAVAGYALRFGDLEKALKAEKPDTAAVNKAVRSLKKGVDDFYKTFNAVSEQKILASLAEMFYKNIPADQHPAYMAEILKKNKAKTTKETFEKFAETVFKKSMFIHKADVEKFLANPTLKALQKDPAYTYALAFYTNYTTNILPHLDAFATINTAEGTKYVKALMEMNPEKKFYPDANSTLRLTYGNVKAYSPKDAVEYKYFTTLSGVMAKENPDEFEFRVPARLKELYNKKDFGMYASKDGDINVGFITNNDITGGNSGSPVINGNGELVGLAFDGNWEAMSGDIYFDSKYKRTICVDVRYVLFMIDKFGGASNLISEMNIIKD